MSGKEIRYYSEEEKLFLQYHDNTQWAQAKVQAGLRLNPQALTYMQQEVDARAARQKLIDEQIAKDKAEADGTGKNNVNGETPHAGADAPASPDSANVQRGSQPDDAGDGADLQRAPGEGSGGPGQAGGAQENGAEGADVEPQAATGAATGNV